MLPEPQDPALAGRLQLRLARQRAVTLQRKVAHQIRLGTGAQGAEIRYEETVGEAVEDECTAFSRGHNADGYLHAEDGARAKGEEEENRVRVRPYQPNDESTGSCWAYYRHFPLF